jgi:hypothetical protein
MAHVPREGRAIGGVRGEIIDRKEANPRKDSVDDRGGMAF